MYLRSGNDGDYLICINPTATEQIFAYSMKDAQIIFENDTALISESEIKLSPANFAILKLN